MGDEEEQEYEEEASLPSSGGRSKLVTILIYVVAVLLGIILVMVISYVVAKNVRAGQYEETINKTVVKSPKPLDTWRFPDEFRVNTADTETNHFVKVKIAYAFSKGQLGLEAELNQRIPQMQDLINIILQGKRKRELTGRLNQLNLREEIKAQINHILREGEIKDVYFTEFIVN